MINKKKFFNYLSAGILLFFVLYSVSKNNYLLYHTVAEFFCIITGILIFFTAYISRKYNKNNYLIFLGSAYLFIAAIDFIHTLSYKGLNIFGNNTTNLATQFWILGRYFEAASFMFAIFFINRKVNIKNIFIIYFLSLIFFGILIFSGNFPECFNENYGLTKFKIISEYLIIFILLINIIIYFNIKTEFSYRILTLIISALLLTVISEFFFTLYKIDVYGLMNFTGHYFKILSYYCLFEALIKTGIKEPFDLLIRKFNYEKELADKYFEFAKIILLVIDVKQNIVSVNKKSCELLKYSKEELIGSNWFDKALPHATREQYRNRFKNWISEGQKININIDENKLIYENIILTKDNKELIIEWNNSLIYDMNNNLIGALYSGKDLTKQRHAEKLLNEQVVSCDMLSTELLERNLQLEELNEFKNEFLSMITHDLRSPLTVINGAAETLLYLKDIANKEKISKFSEMILKNSIKINSMIDNILNLRKIESGNLKLNMQICDICEILKQTIDNYKIVISQKNINLKFDIEHNNIEFMFDKNWISEVILNLINNAVKFTPENGRITVGIKKNEAEITVYIKDSGEGIDAEFIPHLFDKYKQAHHPNFKRIKSGTGLGLAICKKIIEMHNGRIWAESKKGDGASFYFALPVK